MQYSRQVRRQIMRANHYWSSGKSRIVNPKSTNKYRPHQGKNVHYDTDLGGNIIRQFAIGINA